MAIEKRRKRAKADLRRQRRDDAAANTALGGNPDTVNPLAGVVIHARARHHRKRARDHLRSNHLHAGHRMMPRLASVAAITARSRAVTRMAHCRKYASSTASTSPFTT